MEKIFKSLGDKTRVEILLIIYLKPDICLCNIEKYFTLSNSNLSRHLKELEQAELISSYKKGRWKHYKVTLVGNYLVEVINKIDKDNLLFNKIKEKIKSIEI
ncbi:MAG: hypothetical protein Kow0076_3570 [Francisella sp.]